MTKKEQAAAYFCTIVKATTPEIGLEFTVNWRNHPIWGRCPSIRWCGDLIASAQGCGYDKLSAVLADAFTSLVPDICSQSGAGFASIREYLQQHGWKLTCVNEQKHRYKIEKNCKSII